MSQSQPIATSNSHFQSIFDHALKAYKRQTKCDLIAHPLAVQFQSCHSPTAIIAILQNQIQEFDQSRGSDQKWNKWLSPTINVLYALSATLGEGVGLVFSPAKVIFAGIGVLLLAAKDVSGSQEALSNLFERVENFFKRLETYTEVPPTAAMTDIIVKIMVEVLGVLALATKEIKQGSAKKYLKKLAGRTDIEDALGRLDKLTHDEALMATAQILKLAHNVDNKVTSVDDKVKVVIEDGREAKVAAKEAKVAAKEAKLIMQQTANTVDQVKRSQLHQDLRRWLSPPDPSINHNIARGAHHTGTASWFFQGTIFNNWKSSASLLWVHGKPGSGKSILCSTIVQDIESICKAGLAFMAYFYFDFRDTAKQNRRNLLPSLLIQFAECSDPCCDVLSRIYSEHGSGTRQPSDEVLIQCLKDMILIPDQLPKYIVVDALDECSNTSGMPTPREQVLDLVKDLVGLSFPNLHICVTSRPEIDIRSALEPITSLHVSLHDQSGQKEDIIQYVSSVVQSDMKMRRWRQEDKNLVVETLSERADGMFRWVFCQLETLRHCLPPSVRRILEELPETLDETYERILNDINKSNRDHAHRLLQCLTVAVRPLRVDELAEILAVDFGSGQGETPKLNSDWRWEDQEQAVLSTCSSLIAVVDDSGTQVVQFSHFSVKEFLTSSRLAISNGDASRYHIPLEPAHTILAQACLGVLLRLNDQVDMESMDSKFPLALYAAQNWVGHAQFGSVSSQICEGMKDIFDPDKPHFSAWFRVHNIDKGWGNSFDRINSAEPRAVTLYYSALCGFRDLSEEMIMKNPAHVNAMCSNQSTPLVGALQKGHVGVAALLYEKGANLDIRGSWNKTLLHAASMHGPVETARWLLDHGVDVNAQANDGWNALHLAATNGHLEIVRMLLQRGAPVNSKADDSWTALHGAASNGHPEIAQFLLEHGAGLNAQDDNLDTPLHLAIRNYHANSAEVLLRHGADANIKDKTGQTPLHQAVLYGLLECARLLLDYGASIEAEDNEGHTPFRVGSNKENRDVRAFLLERGAKGG